MKPFLRLLALAAALLAPALQAQTPPPLPNKTVIYRIIVNDWLTIRIYGEEELTIKDRVDAQGFVRPQLLTPVNVYGLTLEEAQKKIASEYVAQQILKHPEVSVIVSEPAKRLVTVNGHVKNPSQVAMELETPTYLVDVITKCGGFDDTANGRAVTVTRNRPGEAPQVWKFDVKSELIGKGKANSPARNFELQPGDIVHVPQNLI